MKAGEAGGIEVVVKAMNIHIGSAEICEQGCMSLLNMTANSKSLYSE